jgi:Icc-related predicted phosphoesterase
MCLRAGANAVLATEEELFKSLRSGTGMGDVLPKNYLPVKILAKSVHHGNKNAAEQLLRQVEQLPSPLESCAADVDSGRSVRFVCVSDTHTKHTELRLPPGEVLLHTGDFVGNYGRGSDLVDHLTKFSHWIAEVSTQFLKVVLVAGNHDTLLDRQKCPKAEKVRGQFLASLPQNVCYLEHSALTYRGLTIYGSPVSECRVERQGKRYYSNGFERTNAERQALYAGIPEKLDVLMTHTPPRGVLSSNSHSDERLTERLQELGRAGAAPRYHVFGHDHDYFGVAAWGNTTCINAAQAGMLRAVPGGGGCPLIFDLPARCEPGC